MIQRIQSLFLTIAMVVLAALIFFPLSTATPPAQEKMWDDGMFTLGDQPLLMVGAGMAMALAAFALLQYNNRPLQARLALFGSFICVAVFVGGLLLSLMAQTKNELAIGTFLPLVAEMCFVLAFVFIRKDEKLVRSADRLR